MFLFDLLVHLPSQPRRSMSISWSTRCVHLHVLRCHLGSRRAFGDGLFFQRPHARTCVRTPAHARTRPPTHARRHVRIQAVARARASAHAHNRRAAIAGDGNRGESESEKETEREMRMFQGSDRNANIKYIQSPSLAFRIVGFCVRRCERLIDVPVRHWDVS